MTNDSVSYAGGRNGSDTKGRKKLKGNMTATLALDDYEVDMVEIKPPAVITKTRGRPAGKSKSRMTDTSRSHENLCDKSTDSRKKGSTKSKQGVLPPHQSAF